MVAGRTIRIGVALAPAPRPPSEPSSTLTDNFDDNGRDTGLWNIGVLKSSGSGAVTVNEANQRLEITPNIGAAGYSGYISRGSYDLTNSNIYCKVTETGSVAGGEEGYIGAGQDSNNYYLALISGTNLFLQRNAAGSAANVGTVAYSGTTHAWLRLRYDGTTVYLDTATSSASNPPIESDWTNRFSEARNAAINLSSTKVAVVAGGFNPSQSAAFQFDGFNTATAAVTTTTVTITTATMTYQGQAITVNAQTDVAVLFGSMTYTGQSDKTVQGHSVVAAVMTYAAQAITVNATKAVAVINAVMTYGGQSIAVVQTSIHAISNSTMAYLGRDVTVNANFPPITWLRGLGLRLGERWKN